MIGAPVPPLPEPATTLEHAAAPRTRPVRSEPATPEALAAAASPFAEHLARVVAQSAAPLPVPVPTLAPGKALRDSANRQPVPPHAARSLLAKPGAGFRLPQGDTIPLILLPTRTTAAGKHLLFRLPETALMSDSEARGQRAVMQGAPAVPRTPASTSATALAERLRPGSREHAPALAQGADGPLPVLSLSGDTGIRDAGRFQTLLGQAGEARTEVRDLRGLLETLSGQIRFLVEEGTGKGETLIRLKPPELGVVRLNLVQHTDGVSIRIQVEHAEPRRLIEQSLGELKDSLAAAGIKLDKVELLMGGETRGGHGDGHPDGDSLHQGPEGEPRRQPWQLAREKMETRFQDTLEAQFAEETP